jgi:hemolysin III
MDKQHEISRQACCLKDPMSGLTHCIGALMSMVGLVMLIIKAMSPFKIWHLTTYCIFGTGMILLYTASTLYHWLPLGKIGSARLRKFDHMMIFVLIAATYTPFCLVPLRGPWGWSIFGAVWTVAIMGIVFKLFWINAPRWLTTCIYVLMGWIAIIGIGPITRTLQPDAVFWLFAGGILYSTGALIYAFKKPNLIPHFLGFHEIFHLFVMMGSLAHFWTIYRYVSVFN